MAAEISRRKLFAWGGGAVGVAAAGSLLPPSLQAAMAAEPPAGALSAVKHVVVLMQENRSFDHYFGTLRGVRGFSDRNAVELPSGRPVFEQPAPLGRTVLPFPIRGAAETQRKDLQYIGDLDHSWSGGAKAWHDGWMDGWVSAKTAATMAYYDRQDLPLHYELADAFTVCDAYHSSIHTSTSPNRNHLWSGWTGYEADGSRAVTNAAYAEGTHPGYAWPTYAERLEAAGRSWKTYTEWENFTDNNIEFFTSFKKLARKALAHTGGHTFMESFYAAVRETGDPAERDRLLASLERGVAGLTDAERSLFERGLRRVPTGGLADAFRADVAAGTLPEVSYLVPSAVDSEHPGSSSPVASAGLVYKVLDALGSHPDVWRHTVLLINYDENDGFFDHVPPPVPPAGDADERYKGLPTGLGIRVPLLVVSPWSVGGYVCSEVFDHSSVVRFLERWTGVREPNITPWRRRVTGDLTSAFDFRRSHRRPPVEQPGPVPPFSGRWRPQPPLVQKMPVQEPGSRPARPLPYQPDADAAVDGATATVTVRLRNSGRSAAPLALYPYAGEFAVPQHTDVRGAAEWSVPLAGERYRFTITGPNGFRREFAGPASSPAEVASRVDHEDRDLHLTLRNTSGTPVTYTVRPLGYVDDADLADWTRTVTVKPGRARTVVHSAADAHGWYDVEVTGPDGFRRRLMGHIENGRASVSG
ncbi:phosphocholine-specific phospholipase C [Streptomyces sp. NPDC048604]|uniref:phosphocholine-specific phospholipase C n=1 Tax=Streptomyces sp. NPDC048604 TaxID=3365578 RepID=UPI003717B225